jgi:hypothetical protein
MTPVRVAACLISLACGGCSMMLDDNSAVYSTQPGKYEFLDCPTLAQRTKGIAARETELTQLMSRASAGTGGTAIGALVYRDELMMVRADLRAMQKAADEKRCAPNITPQGAQAGGTARSLY